MRLVFFMRHAGAVRNFDSVLALLRERGHEVHVAFEITKRLAPSHASLLERLDELSITHGPAPERTRPRVRRLDRRLRGSLDYLRYLEPEYADAPKLRERAADLAPERLRRLASLHPAVRRVIGAALRAGRRLPADPGVVAYLRERRADAALVTPLVDFASPQHDYVVAARAVGIPSALLVHSWDNLTNKGLIHAAPDLVTVWNDDLRDEAVSLHGVPAERVAVTGASSYDHWFAWRPAASREELCARVGLDPAQPYLLWLCSSPFVAPHEAATVRRWLEARRAHEDGEQLGLLVRPHPQNAGQWANVDLEPLGDATVYPREGRDPVEVDSRSEYFDCIHHSAAVAGLNTSALIESAIQGKRVATLVTDDSRDTQEGTLHFRLLFKRNGGFLRIARSLDEHLRLVAEAVAEPPARDERFLTEFLRPRGLDQPATPLVVEAVESVTQRGGW